MSKLTRSIQRRPAPAPRKAAPAPPPAVMSDDERKALRRRFAVMIGLTVACCIAAFVGMVGNVSLHQAWGLPLFVLAMVTGFGAQVVFIVGLVKANRPEKGV